MGSFAEQVLKEYPPIIKRKTPTKDVTYRIRLLKRKLEGLFVTLLDIRVYLVTEKRFGFTEAGLYFTKEELDKLIEYLKDAQRNFYKDGTKPRS